MHTFYKLELPSTPLTDKELGDIKNLVNNLAAGGKWKPAQDKGLNVKTETGTPIFTTVNPGNAMVGQDPMSLMVRHTAFAAYAAGYILRLVEEVERLKTNAG